MTSAGDIVLFFVELFVMLTCIWLGSRMGGLGIGFFGGVGVAVYGFGFQMEPGNIPFDVISIIMSVVSAIGCMQVAGGMDYMVYLCSKALKKYPSGITFVGAVLVYVLTVLSGTGHVSYSCLPVIAEVAKESGIRPSRALASAVVGSMIGIVASPISAANAWFSNELETRPYYAKAGYAQILATMIPTTFIGLLVGAFVSSFLGKQLYKEPEFLARVADGRCVLKKPLPLNVQNTIDAIKAGASATAAVAELNDSATATNSVIGERDDKQHPEEGTTSFNPLIEEGTSDLENQKTTSSKAAELEDRLQVVEDSTDSQHQEATATGNAKQHTFKAKMSVLMFLCGIIIVVIYSLCLSDTIVPGWPEERKKVSRNDAIVSMMIATAALIAQFCDVNILDVSTSSTFRAGMNGSLCMLGVAWMGNTFITAQLDVIKEAAGGLFESQAWLLPLVLFIASCLLYSQAATSSALYPLAFDLELSPLTVLASYPAVCGLFILPTYPTLIAACAMDDTGTTKAGKYVFNHPFIIPGTVCVFVSVALSFAIGAAVI